MNRGRVLHQIIRCGTVADDADVKSYATETIAEASYTDAMAGTIIGITAYIQSYARKLSRKALT